MSVTELQPYGMQKLRTEIEILRNQLEYAYRCIERGYATGIFDFSTLRQEAREFFDENDKRAK